MSGYIGNIPVPQATQTRQSFTATASQTTFNTAGYSPGYIDVFLNGVKLAPADYTATNGSDVVLAVGAASNDILEIVAYEIFQVVDQDFTGDFTVDGSTFVVDSTNDRVGIGTSSPSTRLHTDVTGGDNELRIATTTSGEPKLTLYANGAGAHEIAFDRSDLALTFTTVGSNERMRIDSSGNVGIGTSSIDSNAKLAVSNNGAEGLEIRANSTNIELFAYNRSAATYEPIVYNGLSHEWRNSNGNVATIDSSGNFMVGTTNGAPVSNNVVGISARGQYGELQVSTEGSTGAPLYLNRKTSDGDIAVFRKDGNTVGSIGVYSSDNLYLQGKPDHSGLAFGEAEIYGFRNGSENDGVTSLGSAAGRFKDLYLSGGVYLGGTGSANHLDDYEEGTYDVTYSGDSGTPIVRTGNGKYIKIGRMVYISFYSYAGSNPTVPSGSCYVNLPFAADASGHFLYTHIMQGYAGGLSLNTVGASYGRRWQINNSTKLTSYIGTWASSPSYYELSGAGCYLAAS